MFRGIRLCLLHRGVAVPLNPMPAVSTWVQDISQAEIRGRALNDLATEGADVEALIDQHRDIIDEDMLVTLYGRVEAAHRCAYSCLTTCPTSV